MARQLARFIPAVLLLVLWTGTAGAQQKIAYIDSEYLLTRIPEYATVQQSVDRLAAGWERELEQMSGEVEDQFREYQARELLYTNEERNRRRQEIMAAEDEVERQRVKYFGPEGDLFTQQEQLMRPIQERILAAIEEVATAGGYDYVFDKAGDYLFLYARPQYDLSDDVLEELGIDVDQNQRR